MPDPPDIPAAVRDLARHLAEPRPMRRGSLAVRYMKCNKPGCLCAARPAARHGPYDSVVRVVDGKTCSRHVPAADGDRLRQQVQAYWRACEQWADAHLDAPEASERVRPTQEHAEPLSQEIAALFGDTSTGKREHPPRNQD